jgi:molybdopterin converting factor small subunit
MATVRLREPLRKLAGGQSDHEIDGATVIELLEELERSHPPLSGWILDERSHIRRHINVFVNGERGAADSAVKAADRIEILPAISGG